MARKRTPAFLQAAAEAMDLPADVAAGLPLIELVGKGELRMDNHRGILSYGEEEITVSSGRMLVRIQGEKLKISAMTPMSLLITGVIQKLELE
ncbi:MAG: YabP/YqfC family sporulation protein [Oscillospiraceae bacterium]|nr:YabP/YqfC family sporulation protein [Oscillospiraceae bacterium]